MSYLKEKDGYHDVKCTICGLSITKVFEVEYKHGHQVVCSKRCLSLLLGDMWATGCEWVTAFPPYRVNKDTPRWVA